MNGEEMTVNAAGGKQHKVAHRCEALFPRAILEVARLRCEGFEKHGYEDDNYLRIEPKEHIGRALRHIFLWMVGDREDGKTREHLVHACCRVMMALEIIIIKEELYNEIDEDECEYLRRVYCDEVSER